LRRVDPTNQNLELVRVSAFIDGLDPRYAFFVKSANPVTWDAAVEVAKNYEVGFQSLTVAPMVPTTPVTVPAPVPKNESELKLLTLLNDVQSQITALRMEQNQRPNQSNESRQIQCYHCGKRGHVQRECRSNPNNNGNNRQSRQNNQCFNCGKPGH